MTEQINYGVIAFFIYCFIGWIWESSLISMRKKRFINRGFLHGPWLPIYGFGAFCILVTTGPVRSSLPLTFLVGMISASLLEYFTGAAMEKLFHTRYWDYSNSRFNLNGHICLEVSLGWGICASVLTTCIHPHLEKLISHIPTTSAQIASMLLVILFASDVTESVHEAKDTRALLASLSQSRHKLIDIEEKLRVIGTQIMSGKRRTSFSAPFMPYASLPAGHLKCSKQHLVSRLNERRNIKAEILKKLYAKCEDYIHCIDEKLSGVLPASERKRLTSLRDSLMEITLSIHTSELEMASRRTKDILRVLSHLSRNPSAVSKLHSAAFEELTSLLKYNLHRPKNSKRRRKK